MPQPDPRHPEALLAHLDFVRRLARGLLSEQADDLVQDTYVTALQHAPRQLPSLRGWLAVVLRNLSRNLKRGEGRRRWHERRAAPVAQLDPTVEVLAREELRRRVVQAVLDLNEPYRTTILRVYFHGLSSADIARLEEVSPATVRSRHHRAIAMLRQRLDREHGMDRAGWAVPLATLARRVETGQGLLLGALLMKKTLALTTAAALTALALLWVWSGPRGKAPSWDASTGASASTAALSAPPAGVQPAVSERSPLPAAHKGEERVYPAARGLGAVHGLVLDETGEPAASARVVLQPALNTPLDLSIRDDRQLGRLSTTTDGAGQFTFDDVPEGPYFASVIAGEREAKASAGVVAGAREKVLLRLKDVYQHQPLVVEVRDEVGAPAPGVVVQFIGLTERACLGMGDAPPAECTTGSDGRAVLDDAIHIESGIVVARAPSGWVAWTRIGDYGLPVVRLMLKAPGRVHGRITGLPAGDLGCSTVFLHAFDSDSVYGPAHALMFAAEIQDGSYEFTTLPPGRYTVTLKSEGGACLVLASRRNGLGKDIPSSTLDVESGKGVQRDLRVQRGGSLAITVNDQNGSPVAGAMVLATFVPASMKESMEVDRAVKWHSSARSRHPGERRHSVFLAEVKTSAEGRCTLAGLQPGSHRVEVLVPGLCYDRVSDLEVESGVTSQIEFHLEPDGVLQGFVPPVVHSVGLRKRGVSELHYWLQFSAGFFTLPALRPGTYEVIRGDTSRVSTRTILGAAEVRAGETTWIDLRHNHVEQTGIVLDENGPVDGVRLDFGRNVAMTDEQGRFTFDCVEYLSPRSSLTLTKGPLKWQIRLSTAEFPRSDYIVIRLPAHRLGVHTLDSAGQPTSARLVLGTSHGGPGRPHAYATLDTPPSGTIEVCGLYAGGYNLEARFPGGQVIRTRPTLPLEESLVLRALPGGEVEVLVRDQYGVPLAYASAIAVTWIGDGPPPASRNDFFRQGHFLDMPEVGTDGRAHLRGVAAGLCLIEANCDRSGHSWSGGTRAVLRPGEILRVEVEVRVGDQR